MKTAKAKILILWCIPFSHHNRIASDGPDMYRGGYTKIELIHYVLVYSLDESEEDEVAPPLSKRRRAAGREAEGREPIEEVSNDSL